MLSVPGVLGYRLRRQMLHDKVPHVSVHTMWPKKGSTLHLKEIYNHSTVHMLTAKGYWRVLNGNW